MYCVCKLTLKLDLVILESYGRNISQMPGRGGNPVEANRMRNQTEYRGEDVSRETGGRFNEDNTFGSLTYKYSLCPI